MIEIRIHGRGGQGNVVGAYLLATAAIMQGKFGQAFPAFGAERRGAPVVAFVRIAEQTLRRRSQVQNPSFLIVQDQALLNIPGVLDGLKPEGKILVNSKMESEALGNRISREVITLPADTLSRQYLGRPLPNTALLASFLVLTQVLPIEALTQALQERFKGALLERNLNLVNDIAQRVPSGIWKEVIDAQSA